MPHFMAVMAFSDVPYICCRPSVCCLSVMLVLPTHPVEIFGNVSTLFGTLAILDIHGKFYGDRPRGTPPSEG